jgi:hypothetical protein
MTGFLFTQLCCDGICVIVLLNISRLADCHGPKAYLGRDEPELQPRVEALPENMYLQCVINKFTLVSLPHLYSAKIKSAATKVPLQ